jgi:hypothetical protein
MRPRLPGAAFRPIQSRICKAVRRIRRAETAARVPLYASRLMFSCRDFPTMRRGVCRCRLARPSGMLGGGMPNYRGKWKPPQFSSGILGI